MLSSTIFILSPLLLTILIQPAVSYQKLVEKTNPSFSLSFEPHQSQRREFFGVASILAGTLLKSSAVAAAPPQIFTTDKGVKYAVLNSSGKKNRPYPGDIVAVEYTGYLTNGQIFDATHATGKSNMLVWILGNTGTVIPGLDDIVSQMSPGDKVQAIIPPELAFGDKGVCFEGEGDGDCLIKPGSTLVYDVLLKRTSIAPP